MSLEAVREQLKVILSGVSGIGVIHDHQRFAGEWGKYLAMFQDADGRINGCEFYREKMLKNQNTMGEREKAHIFVIHRFMGLRDADATGIVFEDHIEDIDAAFDPIALETLNDTCRTINPDWGPMDGALGIQVDICELRMFGNVLCHFAELRLCAIEAIEQ